MDQLLPTLAPLDLLDANTPSKSDGGDEASLLFSERETERAGGVPVGGDASASLRPELLAQLEHVRAMLRDELVPQALEEACLTCSFQAEDVLLLHLAMELRPSIPVLFLDTGYHFRETYEYRDRIAAEWKLNLTNLLPKETVPQQESAFGLLYQTDPNRCCGLRKVEPLFAAVANYKVWLTGLRREQARSRTTLKEVDDFTLPSGVVVRKLSPFADWTTRDVWQLAAQFNIPLLPLYDQGYTSIGCQPCTTLPTDPNDPRSGRWAGKKVECGIHIQAMEDHAADGATPSS
ncbi:MAG: phosphoadenylyl-sulfate reductase [Janthinobacterium lividum]